MALDVAASRLEFENMSHPRAIGIDLGTTHTVTAVANPSGHTVVLKTREGESLVPSVVLVGDDRTYVGREAQLRGRTRPDRLAACAKRQLGQAFYDHKIGDVTLPPEVIQACLLQAVKREWFADAPASAAVAVPAHFNESQRHAVATAAEMSGLALLDLVNEPIAAALAFIEHTPALASPTVYAAPRPVLVYDLGGYTFEASVLWVGPGHLSLVASQHDSFLGGHDFDLRLADFLAEPFIRKTGADPRSDPLLLEQLVQRACQAKLSLGVRSHTTLALSYRGQVEKVRLAREQFAAMTGDLVERTLAICEAVLRQAGLQWTDLHNVFLVGGSTRMPMIREGLARRLGRPPDDRVYADEAVARGAAIYAARVKQGLAGPPPLRVTSVSTHSLGIEGTEQSGERTNKILIPKGTPLPASATREIISKKMAGQIIAFNVLEGEDRKASKCVTIGRVILRDLPADLADQWPVVVKYEYSAAGRLSVDAHVRYTDRHVHLEAVRPGGVSQAHIARWREAVTSQGGLAAFRKVRAWEKAADAQPPLVIAGIDLARPAPEPPAEGQPGGGPENAAASSTVEGVRLLMQRLLPFAFRRPAADASAAASDVSPAADAGPAPAAAQSASPASAVSQGPQP